MNATKKIADGTLVTMIDQIDPLNGHPVKTLADENGRPGVEFSGGVLTMVTTWDRIAPTAELVLPETVTAQIAKNTDALIGWQRKLWRVSVDGVWIGTYKTKAEATQAARTAVAVLAWHNS